MNLHKYCERTIHPGRGTDIKYKQGLWKQLPEERVWDLLELISNHSNKADAPDGHERIIDWEAVWREWER